MGFAWLQCNILIIKEELYDNNRIDYNYPGLVSAMTQQIRNKEA